MTTGRKEADAPAAGRRSVLRGLAAASLGAALPPVRPAATERAGYPGLIGRIRHHAVRHEDTLLDLARTFNLGFTELAAANPGVDPWIPGAGTVIVVPAAHVVPAAPGEGLLLNLADQRLYVFKPDGRTVESAPIGIGAAGWLTPTGRTKVIRKRVDPTWRVPASIRREQPELPAVVPPGPENPLGKYALDLDWPSYLIHGTNKPMGVGRRVSHGCVRLYPEDIARLFAEVALGTPVTVVDRPLKIAWVGRRLLLEAHPSQTQADQIEATGRFDAENPPDLVHLVAGMARGRAAEVDWPAVSRAVRERRGVPRVILGPRDPAPS